MKKIIQLSLVLVLSTFGFILSTSLISAQSVSLSLSPTLSEIAIKPGKSVTIRYKFTNKSDPAIVRFQVKPFNSKNNTPLNFELQNTDIRLEEAVFFKNSEVKDLLLQIAIPEDIAEKDYYFYFTGESLPPPIQEGTANIRAKITIRSSLLINVTKDGQVEIKPKISIFEVIPKSKLKLAGSKLNIFNSYEKIPVVLVVENKGKNLIKPRGEIIVKGPLWQSRSFIINDKNVLAGSQKKISLELPGYFLGNFKISSNLTFGEGTPAVFASTSFTVLPFKFMGFLLISFLVIFTIRRLFQKK